MKNLTQKRRTTRGSIRSKSKKAPSKDDDTKTADDEEDEESEEDTEGLKSLILEEMVKAVKSDDDDADDEDLDEEEDDDDEEDDDEDLDEEEEKSVGDRKIKLLEKRFERRFARQEKEINRLRKNQNPGSLRLGKDVDLTLDQLAGIVASVSKKVSQEEEDTSSKKRSKKPLPRSGKDTDNEFDERSKSKGASDDDGEGSYDSVEELDGKSVDEIAELIRNDEVPRSVLVKAVGGEEEYEKLRKLALAHHIHGVSFDSA